MARDDRELLGLLRFELKFLEDGGYGRSVREPRKPTSIFLDSPTCLNYADPKRTHPCTECLLMQFVPPEQRSEHVPCHHIPLNPRGDTIDCLSRSGNELEAHEVLRDWLRTTIERLEAERRDLEREMQDRASYGED